MRDIRAANRAREEAEWAKQARAAEELLRERRERQSRDLALAITSARAEKLCSKAIATLEAALELNPEAYNRSEAEDYKAVMVERIRVVKENTAKGLIEYDREWMTPNRRSDA